MHFGNGLAIVGSHNVKHLVDAQFPTIFFVCIQAGIRAEIATEHTDIGGFNMKVAVEISYIPMLLFPDMIRQRTHKSQAPFFEKQHAFSIGYPFIVLYFPGNGFEPGFGNGIGQNIKGRGHRKNFYKITGLKFLSRCFLGIIPSQTAMGLFCLKNK